MRPRIGITTSTLDRSPEGMIAVSAATTLAYARAVYVAGGQPLLLAAVPEAVEDDTVLDHLDGLLLSGGGDIDPARWGEERRAEVDGVNPVRDAYEILLFLSALRRDLPVLGICRGVQVMAVASGGDLWQDIPAQVPGSLLHRQQQPRDQPGHPVRIDSDSMLTRIITGSAGSSPRSIGVSPASLTSESPEILLPVNSLHHQAPRKHGTLLIPVATSPDGIIEALLAPAATFVLGVQWHPEEMAPTDPAQARLFTAFIAAARGPGQIDGN